jgi:uncharacterized protein YdcH (DUF465 family)
MKKIDYLHMLHKMLDDQIDALEQEHKLPDAQVEKLIADLKKRRLQIRDDINGLDTKEEISYK